MATVTFDHMYKRYGEDVVAVNDLNLEIGDGEFICLVGPSGCGKTTALRCVAGLEEISDGQLRIGDRVVNNVAPKDRDIAMVFQSYALYPHMSVFDNLAFGLKLRKTKKEDIDRRVKEAAEILGLERFLDRKPMSTLAPSGRESAARACSPASSSLWPPNMRSLPSDLVVAKFIDGEPMNPATKTFTGWSYSSCGVPTCWRRPSRMTAMRSPMVMASTWSWVT